MDVGMEVSNQSEEDVMVMSMTTKRRRLFGESSFDDGAADDGLERSEHSGNGAQCTASVAFGSPAESQQIEEAYGT